MSDATDFLAAYMKNLERMEIADHGIDRKLTSLKDRFVAGRCDLHQFEADVERALTLAALIPLETRR